VAKTLVQHVLGHSAASASTVDVTVTATTAGNLLVMACANTGTKTVSSVAKTDGTSAFSQCTSVAATQSSGLGTDVWYLLSAPSGVTTWRVTFSGSGNFDKEGYFFEFSGFTTPAFDVGGAVTNGTGSSNSDTGASASASTTDGVGVGVIAVVNSITTNPKTGNAFNAGGDISGATGNAACSIIYTSSGSKQPVWTDSAAAGGFCASTALFKETGGGGGSSPLRRNANLDGASASGPFFSNPLGFHRHPTISLEAYRRDQARKHRDFMARIETGIRRAA
jgi:hypothetical protein